jgi:hypothetical protein
MKGGIKMHILNVEPIKAGGNCLDDVIISMSRWFNRSYEFMYLSSMDFDFDQLNTIQTIGERIKAEYSDKYIVLLEQYHGFTFQFHMNQTIEQGLEIIREQLAKENPVILTIDSYYIPWDSKYMNTHYFGHVFLAVGADPETKAIYGTDPFFNKKAVRIPYDHLQKGYHGCVSVDFVKEEKFDADHLISKLIESLEELLHSRKSFKAIQSFAEELKALQFIESTDVSNNFGDDPLFVALGKVVNGRTNFSKIFNFLNEHYSVQDLDSFSPLFNQISYQWSSIRGLIAKGFIIKEPAISEVMLNNASEKLIKIAQDEEVVLKQLVDALYKTKNNRTQPISSAEKPPSNEQNLTEITQIDYIRIKDLFNNRGFASRKLKADFDLQGYYFSGERKREGEILTIPNMSFQFAENDENGNDNISCFGQFIYLKENHYKSLMFLGTSEMGTATDKITLLYEDGSMESRDFGFSDWWSSYPFTDEVLAWTDRVAQRGKGELVHEVKIYAKQMHINHDKILKRIELPMMPNIHIFALSGSYS